ncbi:MAG: glutathione S-transferase N-terminal domain-containing protein [Myxococcota bacterium]|nr:glutathione S-transferase N-terminal domain-containing protein [Myxococcota bacterium]
MVLPTLYGLAYSPWTYKARWALARKGIEYRYKEYVPMVGKIPLRVALNRWSAPLTVPLMKWDKAILDSSWAIATQADTMVDAPPLHTDLPDVQTWNEIADRILELGRIRISLDILDDEPALRAALPTGLQGLPGGLFIARTGARYMLKTYPVSTSPSELIGQMAVHLEAVRQGLKAGDFLLGEPTYADMTIASSLQMIDPADTQLIPLDERLHQIWSCTRLKQDFEDLCTWRDMVMAKLDAPRLGI